MKRTYKSLAPILFLLLALGAASSLYAQPNRPQAPAHLSPTETSFDILATYDLSGLSARWWSALARDVDVKLRGSDTEKAQAMQKVIFVSTYYPDRGTFNRSTYELYEIWRFHKKESFRVMALAALLANGHDNAMSLVAYRGDFASYAPWDPSPRVRRLTASAVQRYYGVPEIEVHPPEPVSVNFLEWNK